ncbi:MAG: TIGR00266 family protein [Opitutae bacterium]|nr:TIGR00266 family protein [Opitutae bacterium]|tara:strand:+ start:1219 stop:2259 length:1041 start_codon:yes stop_codon:yes gene_type:complete
MQYYYMDSSGQTQGPVEEQKLRELRKSNSVQDSTYVAEVGSAEWKTLADTLPAEATLTGGAPPPPGESGNVPPVEAKGPPPGRKCHEIDYEVIGDDIQVVEIELDPGETVIAEAGAMNYMEDGVNFEAKMGDGSKPEEGFFGKLMDAGKRVITGESIFMTHFTNEFGIKRKVAFAAPYPGKIAALNMAKMDGEILCQKDSFLCAALGTEVSIAFTKKFGAGLFGGEGFILQKLKGDGMAFLHAGGTIVKKELRGEILRVDTGCIVGFTSGISYDVKRAGGLKSMIFGGEGMFLATLSGNGTVWLQSLPFSRLADRIIRYAPSAGGKEKGEGSVLGGIGRKLRGDGD